MRVASQMLDDPGLAGIVQATLANMGPAGGDYVIIRAEKELARSIDENLRGSLFMYGVNREAKVRGGE
jgi:hypothetical protein